MDQKLLTIAIPTWNRDKILEISLKKLLLSVNLFKEDIQLIISDNASTDDTIPVIHRLIDEYPEIDVVIYRQKENTGYYGNFKKCRELASGKFFWLLSDNELILNGCIDFILSELKQKPNIGLIYLNNTSADYQLISRYLTYDQLFDDRNYKLTFISSCILLNNKTLDDEIFDEFKGNSFLGFALLLVVRKFSNYVCEITGEIYQSIPTVVSFNVFKSWTIDIFGCYEYIKRENLFSESSVIRMQEYTLKFVLKDHLLRYRMYNSYYGRDLGSFDDNYQLLSEHYGKFKNFDQIRQIKETPVILLFYKFYLEKTKNKIKKIFKRF